MKKHLKPFSKIFSLIIVFSLLSACFGEDDGDVDTCDYDYELNYYNDMVSAYSNNPTVGTCNNLRDAALDLLDALQGCSDYDYYYDATQAWIDLDCSGLDPNDPGNPGDPGSGSGKATFWTQSDFGCGNITVYVSNSSGTISGYYSGGNPGCGADSCANFNLPPGSYDWTASCSEYNWSGTINITEDNCSTMKLTL